MLLSLEVLPKPIELFYGEKIKTSSKRVSVKSSSNVSALSANALNWSRRPFGWNKRKKSLQEQNWELSNPITNARRFEAQKDSIVRIAKWFELNVFVHRFKWTEFVTQRLKPNEVLELSAEQIRAELHEPSSHDENAKNRAAKTQP